VPGALEGQSPGPLAISPSTWLSDTFSPNASRGRLLAAPCSSWKRRDFHEIATPPVVVLLTGLVVIGLTAGCPGSSKVKITGKITKDGKP